MTNVDPQKINKFSQFSAGWRNLQGPSKTLHEINPLLLQFIKDHLNLSNTHIIDIGCGSEIMAKSLGIQILAEGVETEPQLLFLKKHGCNLIQGYYFSKPVNVEAFTQLLAKENLMPK